MFTTSDIATAICHSCNKNEQIRLHSNRSRCWAIKGSKPIKFTNGSKAKTNIGGFYTEKNEFFWYDLGIKQNTDSFLKSLIDFKRDIGVKIFLLLDRAPWHKSKKAQEFFQKNKHWLKIMYFPPDTPDRNLTEEEMDKFWEKHTFTHKMSHYLK